jgi:hypothetical protein
VLANDTIEAVEILNELFITPIEELNASVLENTSSITNLNISVSKLNTSVSTLNTSISLFAYNSIEAVQLLNELFVIPVTILNASVLANTSSLININYPNPNFSNVSIGASGTLFTNTIQSLTSSANVNLFNNNTGIINFGSNTATVKIGTSGSNASLFVFGRVTATTFNATSDYRLKENIDYNVSLDITRLKPCYYNFINNPEQKIGFIAHEVQEIIPEAVIGVKDCVDHDLIVPQRIDYNIINAASIHTIQNLIKIVADLENRIRILESKS